MKHKIKFIDRITGKVVKEVITTSPFPRTTADSLYSAMTKRINITVEIEKCLT